MLCLHLKPPAIDCKAKIPTQNLLNIYNYENKFKHIRVAQIKNMKQIQNLTDSHF